MWRHFFFFLICMSGTYDITYGMTCDEHNTALLETRDLWRLPINTVQCVDIRSLGNRSFIPDFVGLESVTALLADRMRLKTPPDFALIKLPNLELLDLSGNQLRKIAKDVFVPYQKLDTLLLNDNEIMLPKTPFLNSQSIKTLFLSNNKIRKLKYNTFVQLENLVKVYLDRNLLNQVNPNVFATLKHLKYLHLGSNQLKVLPQIVLFQPEARLIVKGNPFNKTNATIKKEPATK